MLDFSLLNWWAILVATAAAFALGGLWYGPVFGKAWMAALGKTEDDIQPSATPFVVSFFTALITTVVLASAMAANLALLFSAEKGQICHGRHRAYGPARSDAILADSCGLEDEWGCAPAR